MKWGVGRLGGSYVLRRKLRRSYVDGRFLKTTFAFLQLPYKSFNGESLKCISTHFSWVLWLLFNRLYWLIRLWRSCTLKEASRFFFPATLLKCQKQFLIRFNKLFNLQAYSRNHSTIYCPNHLNFTLQFGAFFREKCCFKESVQKCIGNFIYR